jgi:hypothetical protein
LKPRSRLTASAFTRTSGCSSAGRERATSARQFFRILGDELPEAEALAHLATAGFRDTAAALAAIRALEQHASLTSAPTTARNVLANLLAACTEQLARCARPERVAGLHFFSPVPLMKLVEVIAGLLTAPAVEQRLVDFDRELPSG